jgi:hypothetical protein
MGRSQCQLARVDHGSGVVRNVRCFARVARTRSNHGPHSPSNAAVCGLPVPREGFPRLAGQAAPRRIILLRWERAELVLPPCASTMRA